MANEKNLLRGNPATVERYSIFALSYSTDHSMRDTKDIARIGYVVNNYDKVRLGKSKTRYRNKDGSYAKTVEIQKRIGDKFYYVVEAVPLADIKKLRVVSAYINKNDTFLEEAVPNGPSRYVQDESQSNESFSNNSIPRSEENVTKKRSIRECKKFCVNPLD